MILPFGSYRPAIHRSAFIAPGASVIGRVTLAQDSSVWFGCVLRGDHGKISVGRYTNVQDGCIFHEGVHLGEYVTVGHRALLHRCVVHFGDRELTEVDGIVDRQGAPLAPLFHRA